MTLFFMEGFDTYAAIRSDDAGLNMQIKRNWDTNTWARGDLGGTSNTGRNGGNCFYMYSDNSYYNNWLRNFGQTYPTVIIGMSWQCNGSTTGTPACAIVQLSDSAGTEMGRLYYTGGGGQMVWRNNQGTNVLTTAVPGGIAVSVWYTIELKVTAGTTNGYVEIRVNTVSYNAINVNTVGTALTTGMQYFRIGPPGATQNFNTFWLDHLYIMDSVADGGAGGTFNDFLGERRIYTLLPVGPGTNTTWTPVGAAANWQCVNDASGMNQDTTYVTTATPSTDTYSMQQLPASLTHVDAVQASASIRKDDAPGHTATMAMRVSGVNATGLAVPLNADYSTRLAQIYTTNASTFAAWTVTAVNTAEAGVYLAT